MRGLRRGLRSPTIAVCLLFASAVDSESAKLKPTPLTGAENVKVVTQTEAKALHGKAVFYDARKAMNFGKGHVPGAITLSVTWQDKKVSLKERIPNLDRSKLPNDKNRIIIFYSHGPTGWKSYHAARVAAQIGYKNVRWMREGLAGWQKSGYPVEE